jgi:hypothetical protein
VYALILTETERSVGHIRLMACVTNRTPFVVSAVHGLQGYVHPPMRSVAVSDVHGVRRNINSILDNPKQARLRANAILDTARENTWSDYRHELNTFLTRFAA